MRPSRTLLGSCVAAVCLLQSPAAAQQTARPKSESLLLEVIVNGVDTEKVGAFTQTGGSLFAQASELRDLGIAVPDRAAGIEEVELATLPGVTYAVDARAQAISLTVPVAGLTRHVLNPRTATPAGAERSPFGALVNYDVTATSNRGSVDAYGLVSARAFGPYGTIQSDATVTHSGSGTRVVRLGTTYTYSDPGSLRTWAAGDVLTGSLPYTRSVRLGGVQLATNFGLRPDLVTYPLPVVSGGAAVPSTVDVLVNGVRQLSTPVAAGPFSIPQLPVVNGAGQVSVSVRDAAGRQTTQTASFYTSSALLSPGLSSLSIEAGAVRSGFGVDSARYGPFAASVTARRGLTDALTIEGHAEGAAGLVMATGGATARIARFAVATLGLGGSRSPDGVGVQTYAAIERTARNYHLGASVLVNSARFRDIGSLGDDPTPRHIVQANAGVVLGRQGSIGIAWTDVSQRGVAGALPSTDPFTAGDALLRPAIRTSLVSATYSRDLFGRAYFYLTGYDDLRSHAGAVMVGISFRFGGRGSINASYETANHQVTLEASRPALDPGQLGYRVYAAAGSDARALGELRYRSDRGDFGIGVDAYGGRTYLQANARGSLVAMSGGLFASNTVTDGFAVVDLQRMGDVAVTLNNRPVGRTGGSGRLFVPGLVSYQPNVVAIDPNDLPEDARWRRLEAIVVPGERSGAVARFGLSVGHPVLMTVRIADGTPLPVGSRVSVDGRAPVESGFDGQVYFEDLTGRHVLRAITPDGASCDAVVDPRRADAAICRPRGASVAALASDNVSRQ